MNQQRKDHLACIYTGTQVLSVKLCLYAEVGTVYTEGDTLSQPVLIYQYLNYLS